MGKPIVLVVFCIVAVSVILAAASQKHSYVPPKGFVPDEKTAIRIAEAVWSPIYGEATIQSEKPFVASYQATLEVEAKNNQGQRLIRAVRVNGARATFSFPANFRVETVTLDPHYLVLRWTSEYRNAASTTRPPRQTVSQ